MLMVAAVVDGLTFHVDWLGLRVDDHLALSSHSSNEPCEPSQWLCYDDGFTQHNKCIVEINKIISTEINGICAAKHRSQPRES